MVVLVVFKGNSGSALLLSESQQAAAVDRTFRGFIRLKTIKGCWNMRICPDKSSRPGPSVFVSLLLIFLLVPSSSRSQGQLVPPQPQSNPVHADELFRLELVPVAGGAELITIRGRLSGIQSTGDDQWVPLVSVLRDTLGDTEPANDRLRYVWPLTYTRPGLRQRLSGAVPFLYTRVGNKASVSAKSPPPVLDLAAPDRDVWNKIFWTAIQSLLLDPYGTPVKASTRSYRENLGNYRKSHIIRALSVLSLYQAVTGNRGDVFSQYELSEIQARLKLTDKTFGGLVDDLNLERYNQQRITEARDTRGHNWELLRQRAEAESLLFEPLLMPDGSATHALLWVAKSDLAANAGKQYDGRFLNISSPWGDKRLFDWQGYSETRFVDSENRPVSPEALGARQLEMIPLALYGLDNPKIPILLVDFRDTFNPKKRELSRRVLQDVTRNVLSVSRFGDLPYFLSRTVFDFVTGRRGVDMNQPSRLHTYSQLKLLLSLNESLAQELRDQLGNRIERVSLNPLENDLKAEAELATKQYAALLAYAERPAGLPSKIDRDRRAEMVKVEHGSTARVFFKLANILSFGKYMHREKANPELEAKLDVARRFSYHTRFLQEVAKSSPRIDVTWDLAEVKRSLQFILDHAPGAGSKSATVTATVFLRTQDDETRRICLASLTLMTNPTAKNELQRLSKSEGLDQAGKDLLSAYLKHPGQPAVPLTAAGEKSPSRSRVNQ